MIKECKLEQKGGECDGAAASWSAGQPLNSKSTHLIVTCQGYEAGTREEEGSSAREKDGTTNRRNAHRLAPD